MYMIGGSFSFMTRRFTELPDGLGNDWSWVILYFSVLTPISLIDHCLWQPIGAMEAFGRKWKISNGRGRAKPRSMSSEIILSRNNMFLTHEL